MTDKRVEVPEDDGLTYKQRRKAQIKEEKKRTKPSRQALAANSKGGRRKPGRPKGDAGIINEYKARMLSSPTEKSNEKSCRNVAESQGNTDQF